MSASPRPALLRDRSVEISLGAALFIAGAWLIHDAYENRGRKRPFLSKLVLP